MNENLSAVVYSVVLQHPNITSREVNKKLGRSGNSGVAKRLSMLVKRGFLIPSQPSGSSRSTRYRVSKIPATFNQPKRKHINMYAAIRGDAGKNAQQEIVSKFVELVNKFYNINEIILRAQQQPIIDEAAYDILTYKEQQQRFDRLIELREQMDPYEYDEARGEHTIIWDLYNKLR